MCVKHQKALIKREKSNLNKPSDIKIYGCKVRHVGGRGDVY